MAQEVCQILANASKGYERRCVTTGGSGYKVILFDLDGTLTDPKAGITRSVRYALGRLGIEEPDLDSLIGFIGPPLAESFSKQYAMTPEETASAVVFYREFF